MMLTNIQTKIPNTETFSTKLELKQSCDENFQRILELAETLQKIQYRFAAMEKNQTETLQKINLEARGQMNEIISDINAAKNV